MSLGRVITSLIKGILTPVVKLSVFVISLFDPREIKDCFWDDLFKKRLMGGVIKIKSIYNNTLPNMKRRWKLPISVIIIIFVVILWLTGSLLVAFTLMALWWFIVSVIKYYTII